MIYGRFIDFLVLILLPAFALILNKEAESLSIDDSAFVSTSAVAAAAADVVSHAFVQTGSELHYFRDVSHQDILLSSISELGDRHNRKFDSKKTPKSVPLFDSETTDFGTSAIGVPVSQRIFVVNPTSSKLFLTAITSSATNFHCSFFAEKILEPNQRTNFTVYFLPTREGPVVDFVFVHTSIGKISHKVRGNVVGNPYRIHSFFGIKLPSNGTFVAPLSLHNPHLTVMRVVEVFSSDANVQIELAENPLLRSGTTRKWDLEFIIQELAPFETREIVKFYVLGNVERNSTSFIYVKFLLKDDLLGGGGGFTTLGLNDEKRSTESRFRTLVIPMDVQVTRRQGIFSTDNVFDFGLIKYGDKSEQLTFQVYSNIERGVEIESIYVPNESRAHGIYMQFASKPPLSVKCGARNQPGAPVAIAKVNVGTSYNFGKDDSIKINEKLYKKQGIIVAESRGGNYNVTVPYEALIYKGELIHDAEDVAFYHRLSPMVSRGVLLTNNFSIPLAIWNVSMAENGKNTFEVQLTSPIVVLSPQQTLPVLLVKYLQQQKSNFSTYCTLYTNISTFEIPIIIFGGELEIKLNSLIQRKLDFGHVAAGERRSILMSVRNVNPVPIIIKKPQHPWPSFTKLDIESISTIGGEDSKDLQQIQKAWAPGMDLTLPANTKLVFNYSLIALPTGRFSSIKSRLFGGEDGGRLFSENFVLRTNFDEVEFPVTFQPSTDSIVSGPETVSFEDCFIGTVHSKVLRVYSSYKEDLPLHRISIQDEDPRFFISNRLPTNSSGVSSIIKAGAISTLGRLTFLPEASCLADANSNECYVGIPLDTPDGQWFTYGLKLPQNLAEIDSYLYGRLRRKWAALNSKIINTTVLLDTSKVKNFEIPVQAQMKWPRLLSHSVVHFPLTAVGNFTIVNLTLSNPSTRSIVVQLLPLVIYPDAESMLDYFRGEFPAPLIEPIEMNETLMFSLRDTELFTLRSGSPVPKLREELEMVVGTQIPRFTLSMLLRPGMKTRIRIGFLPSDYTLRSSLLLIRNNLTGLEPVVLYGQGAQIRMEIDNKTARSAEPLLFEIQPSHLADCRNPKRLMHKLPTTLTVKRSFVVRNTGEVTFSVMNISINNVPCENRGFRILNCQPFRLEPNEFAVLDVAYTPDFLMSLNDASLQLYMHMNGTPWVFDVSASIPRQMLAMCHAALPRPAFEGVMYYSCVFALAFCLICVLACSYLEGDRTVSCAIRQLFLGGNERKVFDLNLASSNNSDSMHGTSYEVKSMFDGFSLRRFLPKQLRYRIYVQVSPDSGQLVQLWWNFANRILWFFSHFWFFVRGDDGSGGADGPESEAQADRVRDASSSIVRKGVSYSLKQLASRNNSSNRYILAENYEPRTKTSSLPEHITESEAEAKRRMYVKMDERPLINSYPVGSMRTERFGNMLCTEYYNSDNVIRHFTRIEDDESKTTNDGDDRLNNADSHHNRSSTTSRSDDNELRLRKKLKIMDESGELNRSELYDGIVKNNHTAKKSSPTTDFVSNGVSSAMVPSTTTKKKKSSTKKQQQQQQTNNNTNGNNKATSSPINSSEARKSAPNTLNGGDMTEVAKNTLEKIVVPISTNSLSKASFSPLLNHQPVVAANNSMKTNTLESRKRTKLCIINPVTLEILNPDPPPPTSISPPTLSPLLPPQLSHLGPPPGFEGAKPATHSPGSSSASSISFVKVDASGEFSHSNPPTSPEMSAKGEKNLSKFQNSPTLQHIDNNCYNAFSWSQQQQQKAATTGGSTSLLLENGTAAAGAAKSKNRYKKTKATAMPAENNSTDFKLLPLEAFYSPGKDGVSLSPLNNSSFLLKHSTKFAGLADKKAATASGASDLLRGAQIGGRKFPKVGREAEESDEDDSEEEDDADDDDDDDEEEDEKFGVVDSDGKTKILPEWAESELAPIANVDEDFNALSLNTAALLFDDGSASERFAASGGGGADSASPLSSSSLSSYLAPKSFQRTPRRPTKLVPDGDVGGGDSRVVADGGKEGGGDDTTAESSAYLSDGNPQRTPKRRKKYKQEDPEVKRYIGRLTRDYRERLKLAIANGLPINDGFLSESHQGLKLTLPDDLTANPSGATPTTPAKMAAALSSRLDGGFKSVWPLSPQSLFNTTSSSSSAGPFSQDAQRPTHGKTTVSGEGFDASKALSWKAPLGVIGSNRRGSSSNESSALGSASKLAQSAGGSAADNFQVALENLSGAALPPWGETMSTEHFLFAESDPIWKPIFEEQSGAGGNWPTDFTAFGGGENLKKDAKQE